MKENGTYYPTNVTPCKESGHSVRSKSGHCVMCKKNWEFLNKCKKAYENIEAYTYIAASEYGKIVKIGYSKNIKDRKISLNKKDKYSGFSDWQIVYYLKSNKANKLETETLKNTYCYNFPCQYYKGSKLQTSYEAQL